MFIASTFGLTYYLNIISLNLILTDFLIKLDRYQILIEIEIFLRVNALYCDNTILRHALLLKHGLLLLSLAASSTTHSAYGGTSPASTSEYRSNGSSPFSSFQKMTSATPGKEVLKPTIPCDMADFTQYYGSIWIGTPDSAAKFNPAC